MVTKRIDYLAEAVEAARSVMIELTRMLGEYSEGIVIVGGWVPELLFGHAEHPHTGSLDVDLALDHRALGEVGYQSILQILKSRGYRQGEQPFIFFRTVHINSNPYEVEVDFLSGEYGGTTRKHRTQKVQDMLVRKARGSDLVFTRATEISLSGSLPDGGVDQVRVRVASIAPFLVMKAMALSSRLMEKDAWDIYYCICNYPGGIEPLADEIRPLLKTNWYRKPCKPLLKNLLPRITPVPHTWRILKTQRMMKREPCSSVIPSSGSKACFPACTEKIYEYSIGIV
jgi:hypothetical protein